MRQYVESQNFLFSAKACQVEGYAYLSVTWRQMHWADVTLSVVTGQPVFLGNGVICML